MQLIYLLLIIDYLLIMDRNITEGELQKLFTKPYGGEAPSRDVWASYYEEDVLFIDPTQEKYGLVNNFCNSPSVIFLFIFVKIISG